MTKIADQHRIAREAQGDRGQAVTEMLESSPAFSKLPPSAEPISRVTQPGADYLAELMRLHLKRAAQTGSGGALARDEREARTDRSAKNF